MSFPAGKYFENYLCADRNYHLNGSPCTAPAQQQFRGCVALALSVLAQRDCRTGVASPESWRSLSSVPAPTQCKIVSTAQRRRIASAMPTQGQYSTSVTQRKCSIRATSKMHQPNTHVVPVLYSRKSKLLASAS